MFKTVNTDLFVLPGNPHMLHCATISEGLREYVAILCIRGPKKGNVYIEEAVLHSMDYSKDVYAGFKFIQEDKLAEELAEYCRVNNLIDMKKIAETLIDSNRAKLIL